MPSIEQIVATHLPRARIVSIDGRLVDPSPETLLEKYKTLSAAPSSEDGTVAVVVQLPQQDPPVPASLLRRTLLVDPVAGEVIGTSG